MNGEDMLMWGLGTGGINKWNLIGGVQGGRIREQLQLAGPPEWI